MLPYIRKEEGPPANYAAQKQELDGTIARLNALLGDQSAGQKESRDDTRRQAAVRKTPREKHLAPISRIAKAMLRWTRPSKRCARRCWGERGASAVTWARRRGSGRS